MMCKRKKTITPQKCAPEDMLVWDCHVLEYGDVLDGWRIEKFVMKGGFGAVYLASDCNMPERKAAVKIFADDVESDANNGIERIRGEAEIMRAVGSTYAPDLYRAGDKEGRPYIIMEYMEAIGLDDGELQKSEDEIREFILELVAAVRALHEQGWIHCDLKPANIARRWQDGRIVLLDFGSAHRIEQDEEHVPSPNTMNTRRGEYVRVETRGYAPPELCFQPCRDIYAIGHVIRDCFKQDVPLEWSLIINKCIANDRRYRYADLQSLCRDVENIDRIGRDEMRRCIYEDRCRFMNLQAAISAEKPTTYSWVRLKDFLEGKQKGTDAIYAGAGQLFIDFQALAPSRSISIVRPVTLSEERYVVIKGPGVIRMDLDATLCDEDDVEVGILDEKGNDEEEVEDISSDGSGRPALVFLMNNATLINTTKKKLEDGNIFYVVGDSCYLNFPNVPPNAEFNWKYVVSSNLGYSFALYRGPKDMAILIGQMNKRLENSIPQLYMMSAREFFQEENSSEISIRDYVDKYNLMRKALGLPLPEHDI